MMNSRAFFVAANWKMYKSPREAVEFFKTFLPELEKRAYSAQGQPRELNVDSTATVHHEKPRLREDAEEKSSQSENSAAKGAQKIVFFVPAIDLWVTEQALRGSGVEFGAQNVHFELEGAFTGENSVKVLSEIGARHALVGHSERRTLFGEDDSFLAKKVKTVQAAGLCPMLCVGETLSERESGATNQVIQRQLRAGLALADLGRPLTIAYEPVWAIGTGKVASPEQANQAHVVLRAELRALGGETLANRVSILYGGSVKPENARELREQPEIDGFLVGGASLKPESFLGLL